MSTWIPLTQAHIEPLLTGAQREALLARPNQGFDSDPLSVAMSRTTTRLRLAIIENEQNTLSDDQTGLPPELISTAASLCLGELDDRLPGMSLNEAQQLMLEVAVERLFEISGGDIPVSLPSDVEPVEAPSTRGVSIVRRRERRLTSLRLAGL